jgi:hypothetical protein
MKNNKVVVGSVLGVALLCGSALLAQSVNPRRHPNLAAAQRFCDQAYAKISAAQAANEWDMNGHAAKAKDLLDEANHELKKAAEAANENHK